MPSTAKQLIAIAKSLDRKGEFGGYYDLVDALAAKPVVRRRWKSLLSKATAAELDDLEDLDSSYGWLVRGAADAMGLLPDDSRFFLSKKKVEALPQKKVLGELCSACIVNDVETVALLCKRVNVNRLDHNQQSALGYAVGNNHPECVHILLGHGADPNLREHEGAWTTLEGAASSCCSRQIFAMLLDAGGDLEQKNADGETVVEVLKKVSSLQLGEAREIEEVAGTEGGIALAASKVTYFSFFAAAAASRS